MSILVIYLLTWLSIVGLYYELTLAYILVWILYTLSMLVSSVLLLVWESDHMREVKDKLVNGILGSITHTLLTLVFRTIPTIGVLLITESYNTLIIVAVATILAKYLQYKLIKYKMEGGK